MTDTQTPNPNAFDGWTLRSLKDHIEDLAPVVAELDDSDLRDELRAEYEAAVEAFHAKSPYGDDDGDSGSATSSTTDAGPTVKELIDEEVGDDDHFLRHVEADETTFSGRHTRTLDTTVEDGHIVHKMTEDYADDAHGESLSWTRHGVPQTCPHCDADTQTDDYGDDGDYIETAVCPDCPFHVKRVSVDAPFGDSDAMKPIRFEATYVHAFDDEADVDWEEMKDELNDTDRSDIANIVRALTIKRELGAARDKAYDSDDGLQTLECGHCGTTVDEPAATTHAHFGKVCPDCEGVEVWTPDDADLPDDVASRMDEHKTFNPDRIVRLLRDTIHYADYRRTNLDDEDDADKIPDGINTGRGGKIDAHGMGRGRKGTGLRRPDGAFHNFAHWRTVLADAKETGLIERADSTDVDDDHKDARWTATDKGRDVFNTLARCRTCGDRKRPYKHIHTYQSKGRYTNKDTRLTLACAACDQMSDGPSGMTISSSAGRYTHKELNGVDYDE